MPLILAVEPNSTQAQQLAALARQYLRAELVTAPSAKAALEMLGDRIPDLILTPALLAPRDEAALTERLRELGHAASHVQTLAVPILASVPSRPVLGGGPGGLLGRRREKGDIGEPVGCEPSVFAEQIQIYLERAAHQRESIARAAAPAPPLDSVPQDEEPLDVIFDVPMDLPTVDGFRGGGPSGPHGSGGPSGPPDVGAVTPADDVPPAAASGEPAAIAAAAPPPPARPAKRVDRRETKAVEAELGLIAPSTSTPLWRVAEDIEDFYKGTAAFAPQLESEEEPVEQAAVEPVPLRVEPDPVQAVPVPLAAEAAADPDDSAESPFVELNLEEALADAGAEPAETVPDVFVVEAEPLEAVVAGLASGGLAEQGVAEEAPAPVASAARMRTPKAPRRKKSPPPVDDWAYFDPTQAPFKALVRRLDEIAGHAGAAK